MNWFLYNFLLKSLVSSKRQLCHVETINFSTRQQMNKIAGNVLKHLTARRATRASQCFTGILQCFTGVLQVFYRYFTVFESYAAVILSVRNLLLCLTMPVPFPLVYFHLLNNVITSREVLQKLSVWTSKLVMYLVPLSPLIKVQSVYLMKSFVLFCLVFAAVFGTWN